MSELTLYSYLLVALLPASSWAGHTTACMWLYTVYFASCETIQSCCLSKFARIIDFIHDWISHSQPEQGLVLSHVLS